MTTASASRAAAALRLVVAVDGGGDKTDAVAVTIDGDVRAHAFGPGSNPRVAGVDAAAAVLARIVGRVLAEAGAGAEDVGVHGFVSGLNVARDTAALRQRLADAPWARRATLALDNDMPATLRAGTDARDAVAVVCGTGINAIGVRADGATARFAALGTISGDWGGGWELGQQALWHAARARDGRGPSTTLVVAIPEALDVGDLADVIAAVDAGRLPHAALRHLAPTVLAAASEGDPVAGALVDRQADEIVTLAVTTLTRLGLQDVPVPVVLGGGVVTSGDQRLGRGIQRGLAARAPRARPTVLAAPPVAGAALLAVAAAGGGEAVQARVRARLTAG